MTRNTKNTTADAPPDELTDGAIDNFDGRWAWWCHWCPEARYAKTDEAAAKALDRHLDGKCKHRDRANAYARKREFEQPSTTRRDLVT